jgi:hypothetical protein
MAGRKILALLARLNDKIASLRGLTSGLSNATLLAPSDADREKKGLFAVLLWLFAPLLFLTVVALWFRDIHFICFIGLLVLARLAWFFWDLKRMFDEGERHVDPRFSKTRRFQWSKQLALLILATIAAVGKLICDIDVYFATAQPRGLISGLLTFGWISHWDYLAILILGVFTYITGFIIDIPLLAKSLKAFGVVELACSLYILLCGEWGKSALESALRIFSLEDLAEGLTARQDAASSLYQVQGKRWFYILFCLIPLLCLVISYFVWLRQKKPRPTIAGRGFIISGYVLFLGVSVAYQVGHIAWAFEYVYFHGLKMGNPIDRKLFDCASPFMGEKDAANKKELLACYKTAAGEWETELEGANARILPQLPNSGRRGKVAFATADKLWRIQEQKYFIQLRKQLQDRPDHELTLIQRRMEHTRARANLVASWVKP